MERKDLLHHLKSFHKDCVPSWADNVRTFPLPSLPVSGVAYVILSVVYALPASWPSGCHAAISHLYLKYVCLLVSLAFACRAF